MGASSTTEQVSAYYTSVAESRTTVRTSEDVDREQGRTELYQKFFRNYTRKQSGLDASQLDATVTSRVPVRVNRDSRCFTRHLQAMPRHGYTRMFERMLAHPTSR